MLVKKPGKCAAGSHKYGQAPAFHSSINRELPSVFRQQKIEVFHDMSQLIQADSDDNTRLPVIEVDLEVSGLPELLNSQVSDNILKPSQ